MRSVPILTREYRIIYYPPKSTKTGSQLFTITVLSLCFFIGALPMILIFGFEVNEVFAFVIAALCTFIFLFGIQPLLIKRAGKRAEIIFNSNEIRIEQEGELTLRLRLAECAYRWYEYGGSDEADLAGIEVFPREGLPLKIERKYALEGDFEVLLSEFQGQKIGMAPITKP